MKKTGFRFVTKTYGTSISAASLFGHRPQSMQHGLGSILEKTWICMFNDASFTVFLNSSVAFEGYLAILNVELL
jgi:hypothetical protein